MDVFGQNDFTAICIMIACGCLLSFIHVATLIDIRKKTEDRARRTRIVKRATFNNDAGKETK